MKHTISLWKTTIAMNVQLITREEKTELSQIGKFKGQLRNTANSEQILYQFNVGLTQFSCNLVTKKQVKAIFPSDRKTTHTLDWSTFLQWK